MIRTLLSVVLLSCVSSSAADLILADAGKSSYTIVTPARPNDVEKFAAAELQEYLHRITGAEMPIVREGARQAGPFISVGATAAALRAAAVPKPRYDQDDSFVVRADGKHLYVAGAVPRGTLYAAYELLKTAGCRFFAPGYKFYRGYNELVPRASRLAVDGALKISEQPAFKLRGEYPEHYYNSEADDVIALLDWAAKNRINLVGFRQNEFSDAWYNVLAPEAIKRGLLIGTAGHGYDRFIPRDKYFRDHPEWFAEEDGERTDRYFNQFCTSHPQAIATFTKNLADFARRYPALYFISGMPNDSPRWCQCKLCTAQKLTSRDRLFKMIELQSKTIHEVNPKLKLEVSAGVDYFGVKADEIPASPYNNLTYRGGVLRRCLRHAWNDAACEFNRPQYETASHVTKKIAAEGKDIIWTSRYGSFREHSLPGIVYPTQMQQEMADLKKIGGAGVLYNYATAPDWIPFELKHYLYARLLSNPAQPVEAFLNSYYADRFPGSPREAAAFYTALRSAMERYDFPGGGYTRESMHGLYPDGQFESGFRDMDEAQKQVDAALRVNKDHDQKQLLWLLKSSALYGRAKMEIDRLAQSKKIDEARARAMQAMDYVESFDGRGIFYDSVFLRRSLEYRFTPQPRDTIVKKRPWEWIRMYEYREFLEPGRRRTPNEPQ